MSDIFISYARADFERVKLLAEILARRGWSVWWDQAILAGKPFDEIIEKALSCAHCAIVLWTRASVQSQWVRAEAGEGLRQGILIPILFEDIEVPLVFRQLQTAVMLDWHGEISHPGFKRLEQAIGDMLGLQATHEAAAESHQPLQPAPFTLSQKELEAIQRELSLYLGPISKILVQKTNDQATSKTDLYQRLANHIAREDERSLFIDHCVGRSRNRRS